MNEARMRRAIAQKRDGAALSATEWGAIVDGVVAGGIDDAQLAALLMACVLRGLDDDETHALTDAFVASGERLTAPDPRTVDKHSSGGVADTASLIVVPLVAACGVPVAKLSGRALGHTGGTLDKLEAIPGLRTDLEPERFFACVAEAGCAVAAQSARLVPADKHVYALRDRTATVPSRGLIAASIVSKKIAGGAHAIVFDVKAGSGAFVSDAVEARELARTLVALARAFGRRASAIVSDMNEPLGPAIGTGLEAIEARAFLAGPVRDARLDRLCRRLAAKMLAVGGFAGDAAAAIGDALASGAALATFERMVRAQGAAPGALASLRPHPVHAAVRAPHAGYVARIDTVALGELARDLVARAGPVAGIVVNARLGDERSAGEALATVFGDAAYVRPVAAAFELAPEPPAAHALVRYEID